MRDFWRALGWAGMLTAMSWLAWVDRTFLYAEEASAEKKPSHVQSAAKAKEPKSPYRRLPPYYGQVVTPEQRKQIYAIQDEYGPKIDALRKQLEALIAERDEKIAALLTEVQRKEVARLQEEAKAKRAPKEKAVPPGETKPSGAAEKAEAKPTEATPPPSVQPSPPQGPEPKPQS